jgi:hypothetical protein
VRTLKIWTPLLGSSPIITQEGTLKFGLIVPALHVSMIFMRKIMAKKWDTVATSCEFSIMAAFFSFLCTICSSDSTTYYTVAKINAGVGPK